MACLVASSQWHRAGAQTGTPPHACCLSYTDLCTHTYWLLFSRYFIPINLSETQTMSDSLLDIDLDTLDTVDSAETQDAPAVENAFAQLGIAPELIENLTRNDILVPTPVQKQGIPLLIAGSDLIACAPTGTGKTAAFVLPALQRLLTPSDNKQSRGARVVVLTPTRELAQQVSKAAMMMAGKLPRMKTVCVTGGEPFRDQLRNIGMPHEILVATPGRLLDHITRGRIDLSRVEMFVLDEADRMLDMGFSDDVQEIASKLPAGHQTICFSATFDDSVKAFAKGLLNEPAWLEVAAEKPRHETILQQCHYADGIEHKRALLQHWLNLPELGQAVVFTATKRDAEELAMTLRDSGLSADPLHGDMVQRQRTRMVQRLRRGETQILVATDVAARGIDVPGITHVFNFDLPKFAEDYVHRIGRTGRAGRTGAAISFVSKIDLQSLGRIEKLLNTKIDITEVEGLEARFKPQAGRGFGGGGGRRDGGGYGRRDGGGGYGRRDGGGSSGGYAGRRDGGSSTGGGYAGRRDAAPSTGGGYAGRRDDDRPRADRSSHYGERSGGYDRPVDRNNDRNDRFASDRPARPQGDRPARTGQYDRPARPNSERFDSRTDSRYGDRPARSSTPEGGRPHYSREGAARATSHHHGQEERKSFQERDNNGGQRRERLHAPRRHDSAERHH